MHELAVTQSILEIAERHARQNEASRVTDLYVVIGALSSIVDDSVQFYWDMLSENSLCAGSTLHFKRIPSELLCLDCTNPYTLEAGLEPCPTCGSPKVKVISGDQFYLDSIEIVK